MNVHVQLNEQQELAAQRLVKWLEKFKEGEAARPFFVLSGYAGTGKSFALREILRRAALKPAYMAYTGKAALVLQKYSNVPATTIHSRVYRLKNIPEEMFRDLIDKRDAATGREKETLNNEIKALQQPQFVLNTEAFEFEDILILDECSMVDETVLADLLSFEKPIVALGDPGQLPPIKGEGVLFQGPPDVMLTNVLRQAKDSPILSWSMKVRNQQQIPSTDITTWETDAASKLFYSQVAANPDLLNKMLLEHDVIICWKHETRRKLNTQLRKLKGFYQKSTIFPVKGDTLIVTKNDKEKNLFNGLFAQVLEDPELYDNFLSIKILTELGNELTIKVLNACFTEYEDTKVWDRVLPWEHRGTQKVDFGYALTCHKAQGSQWEKVLVFEEDVLNWHKPGVQDNRARWLYTAITRAVKKVTLLYGKV